MPKSRIYEIAQELNKTNKEVIEFLKEKKVEVKSHMSTLEEKDEKMVRDAFTGKNEGKEEKKEAQDMIEKFYPNAEKIYNSEYIYSVVTKWNDGLEKLKLAICDEKLKYISFDIFDTLLVRPFMYPTDLFEVLSNKLNEKTASFIDFAIIRRNAEETTRSELHT